MPTVEEYKAQQRSQWSGNAASWDIQHDRRDRETAPVTQWLCREAGLQPGMRVLDLACGSGNPAIAAARVVEPGGSVVATDLVPEMVEATRRRVQALGLDHVDVRVMDAEENDFPDDSFDAVTCRFGFMFCPRVDRALAQTHRVLNPGGRLALAVWSAPEHSPAQTVAGEALRRFGRPTPAANFDAPGIYQLAPQGKLEGLLQTAGFTGVRTELLSLTSEYESLEAFISPQAMRTGSLRSVLEEATPEEAERLKTILAEVLAPYTQGGVIRLTLTPLCAVATK